MTSQTIIIIIGIVIVILLLRRGEAGAGRHKNVAGFCKSAKKEEIVKNGYVLTPGRYVGVAEEEDDGVPFEEKMKKFKT